MVVYAERSVPIVPTRNLKMFVTPCSTDSANKASEIRRPTCHGSISVCGRGVVYKTLVLYILPGQKAENIQLTFWCTLSFFKHSSGLKKLYVIYMTVNPLNPELNPICHLLALLGAHHFLHVSRTMVKSLTLRLLMSYIYIYIYSAYS